MDPTRWRQIQDLFHQAVALPSSEQRSFLDTVCRNRPEIADEVLGMLEEDASGASLLDHGVAAAAHRIVANTPPLGKEFGGYRVIRFLGEGGMGVVYLCERKAIGDQVALKVLRDAWLSPSRRRRFGSEQRTLAQLNHPSIARL